LRHYLFIFRFTFNLLLGNKILQLTFNFMLARPVL